MVDLVFSDENQNELVLFVDSDNKLFIKIENNGLQYIVLDRYDAIRLSKELKNQINIINTNIKEFDNE